MTSWRVSWLDDKSLQLEDHRTQDEATTRAQELRDAGRLVYPDSPYQVDGIEWNDEETP